MTPIKEKALAMHKLANLNIELQPLMRLSLPIFLFIALFHLTATAQNIERGKEVNGTCAACHGEHGIGGKRGEYPRIAGQRTMHIEEQLRNFRSRVRVNIPMFPYTQERELSDDDIKDVSAYLASIVLPTTPPDFKDDDDALTRLLAMEKVMIIPKLDGNLENGKTLYEDQCQDCHGRTGLGKGRYPMLVGQYTNYLLRQIDSYIKGERTHDDPESKGILAKITTKDIDDIIAYITRLK
jgi:cytochrome c553